jgi:hypothetical protein
MRRAFLLGAVVDATRRRDGTFDGIALRPDGRAERVSLQCRVDGDHNVLLVAESERYRVGSDGSVEFTAYGAVSDRTDASISVRSADGTVFTCAVPPGLDLSAFPVGTQVKLHCHRLDGHFRLGFIKSDKAVVEVPH